MSMGGTEMQKFNELIRDQFVYGGQKYALNAERESTDILFETFGPNWLHGTMAKYCFRFTNLARERDLLKIACYCYIMWLKRGFWVKKEGLKNDVLDTTVELKSKHFDLFLQSVGENDNLLNAYKDKFVDANIPSLIFSNLKTWASKGFTELNEIDIVSIYLLCFVLWQSKYEKVEVHDTDTAKQT